MYPKARTRSSCFHPGAPMIDHSAPFVAAASMADAIAQSRTTMVQRASDLLSESASQGGPGDVLPDVAGLLGATLEELKVAEEELRYQNERFSTRHADAMRAE